MPVFVRTSIAWTMAGASQANVAQHAWEAGRETRFSFADWLTALSCYSRKLLCSSLNPSVTPFIATFLGILPHAPSQDSTEPSASDLLLRRVELPSLLLISRETGPGCFSSTIDLSLSSQKKFETRLATVRSVPICRHLYRLAQQSNALLV